MSDKAVVLALGCVLAVLVAVLVGGAACYVARRGGASFPAMLSTAGVAFATTLGVAAAVTQAVTAAALLR
jgi:hypothetical protein